MVRLWHEEFLTRGVGVLSLVGRPGFGKNPGEESVGGQGKRNVNASRNRAARRDRVPLWLYYAQGSSGDTTAAPTPPSTHR